MDKEEGDWCCYYCNHFTVVSQDYCAGCGKERKEI